MEEYLGKNTIKTYRAGICASCHDRIESGCDTCKLQQFISAIEDAPGADVVKVQRASWKWACSRCGYKLDGKPYTDTPNYCPNCGSLMCEENEE